MNNTIERSETSGKPRLCIPNTPKKYRPEKLSFFSPSGKRISSPKNVGFVIVPPVGNQVEFNSWELSEPLARKFFAWEEQNIVDGEGGETEVEIETNITLATVASDSAVLDIRALKIAGIEWHEVSRNLTLGERQLELRLEVDVSDCKTASDIDRKFEAAVWNLLPLSDGRIYQELGDVEHTYEVAA